MQQDDKGNEEEDVFQDESCNRYIAKITDLEALIEVEKTKLFEAMRKAKKLKESLKNTFIKKEAD